MLDIRKHLDVDYKMHSIFFLLLALHVPKLFALISKSFHHPCWISYKLVFFNLIT